MDIDKIKRAVEFFKGYRYENEHHVIALREAASALLRIMEIKPIENSGPVTPIEYARNEGFNACLAQIRRVGEI